jgi:hypothetical protein
MNEARLSTSSPRQSEPFAQLRIWHLALLVAYVAIAIVDIETQRLGDPVLVGLASVGFIGYGLLVWLTWRMVRHFEARFGTMPLVIAYLVAMMALFMFANVVYLVIEHAYRQGLFRAVRWDTLSWEPPRY